MKTISISILMLILLATCRIMDSPRRVENALCNDYGYRVMFDGCQYKVEKWSYLGGWEDDKWGGYLKTKESAQVEIETSKAFARSRRNDKQRIFKEVKP